MRRRSVRRGGHGGAVLFVAAGAVFAAALWGTISLARDTLRTPPAVPAAASPAPTRAAPDLNPDERWRAVDRWRATEEAAYDDLDAGHWYRALSRITAPECERALRFARPYHVSQLEEAIRRQAAEQADDPLDDGLHAIVLHARQIRDCAASGEGQRNVADRALRWASAKLLEPYGWDRILFARRLRECRIGAGELDGPSDAPVRRLELAEAAARLERIRGGLRTWFYERRVVRTCAAWRRLARSWEQTTDAFRREWTGPADRAVAALVPDLPDGAAVDLDPARPPDALGFGVVVRGRGDPPAHRLLHWRDLPPAAAAGAVVVPRLDAVDPRVVADLAHLYAEMGEPGLAALCRADARRRGAAADEEPGGSGDRGVGPALDREIDALVELESLAGRTVPATLRDAPRLEPWMDRHRSADAAHLLGGQSLRDVGCLRGDALEAYVDGGLVWAPEQWAERTERLRQVTPDRLAEHAAHRAWSDHFRIVTDVSPDFAADAGLVLDAAYEQVALALRLSPRTFQEAVIYAREHDYRERFRDQSGGLWSGEDRSLFTYLYNPEVPRFSRFHYPTLTHEAAHAVLGTATYFDPPSWLHEGIACYFERWNPTRSVAANERATGGTLRRTRALRAAEAAGDLPDLATFLTLESGWDVDDFGPRTLARYAMAESLFVHLMGDPALRPVVGGFLRELAQGRDPAASLDDARRAQIERSWRAFAGLAPR